MSPAVEAVIFDWGGTITPWHPVDRPEQGRAFARQYHVAHDALADELADRIHAAEAGVVAGDPRVQAGLTAYRQFWEPRRGPLDHVTSWRPWTTRRC